MLSLCLLLTSPLAMGLPPAVEQLGPDGVAIHNAHLAVEFRGGHLRRVTDRRTGEVLLEWTAPAWAAAFGNERREAEPSSTLRIERRGDALVAISSCALRGTDRVHATYTVTLGAGASADLAIAVRNDSPRAIEEVFFPANGECAKGRDRYLVLPYQSGMLLPLDDRFGRILLYNALPFVHGYPSNLVSMQWLGAYGPAGGWMLMGLDRTGTMRRMGARDDGDGARIVHSHHAAIEPGGTFEPAPCRIVALPGGDYGDMAAQYRKWLVEDDRAHDEDGRILLRHRPIEDKLEARPHLDACRAGHGYPEHAARQIEPDLAIPYVPYGMAEESLRQFRAIYRTPITPQLWSPFVEESGGWKIMPPRHMLERPSERDGVRFPGCSLGEFIAGQSREDGFWFLYTNPSFWAQWGPGFDITDMLDANGDGVGDVPGGFEAMASGEHYYTSPALTRGFMADQFRRLVNGHGAPPGIMYDSSQVFGAVLWSNSRIRGDAVPCVDHNPKADYPENWGYFGRDSYVQEKLRAYHILNRETPEACKVGEWICELETLFLDLNAGSICLNREYPDTVERPDGENPIPVPLFQMVYGDTEFFVIRVGAASDASLGAADPSAMIGAEVARRASSMFGAIHQVVFWGGVHWAGPAYGTFRPRTWMVLRDNALRRETFGLRADHRMLNREGHPVTAMYALRETTWAGSEGRIVGVYVDNNSGSSASAGIRLGGQPYGLHGLWGDDEAVPGSLGRLRRGSTVTLAQGGLFSLWSFSGTITRGGEDWLRVEDTAETPEGLVVIWDGEYLSFANEAPIERTVTLSLREPLPPLKPLADLQPVDAWGDPVGDTVRYDQSSHLDTGRRRVVVTLPAAEPAAPGAVDVPATICVLRGRGG